MTANFRNRTLYHGDNLEFLRGINSETIDLVATDPPFNKGRDFHATPDSLAAGARFHDRWSWEKDVEGEWIDQIKTDWPAVQEVIDAANHTWGEDMGAFLCYMGVRLMEMHRLLKPTGSLWLHCDDTAGAYLTMLLDGIFGRRNRQDVVTWQRQNANNSATKSLGRICDTILRYTKSDKFTWNIPRGTHSEATLKKYRKKDADGRLYKPESLTAPSDKVDDPRRFEWRGMRTSASRVWLYDKETLEQMFARGEIITHPDGRPMLSGRISYLDEVPKPKSQNLWLDLRLGATNSERTGYPTQKPVDLYRRIVLASSNPGDVVLDPFCGCATTLIAAEQEGRQWIGMDLWDEALTVVQERLDKECGNVEQGKLWSGTVFTADTPPARTDDGAIAAPPLKSKRKGATRPPEPGPVLPRDEMLALLITQQEGKCAGCNRAYDDPRIWQIDHLNPRSAGGVNHHSNRCLLCPPCNGIKSDTMTLTALRNYNRKNGLMA